MFGDWGWDESRSAVQMRRLGAWLDSLGDAKVAVVECGAGTALPTVRHFCEQQAQARGRTLIRINPREPSVPAGQISMARGAMDTLQAIDALIPSLC